MISADTVMEYKCPCCGAGLRFGQDVQKMTCEYCDNTFELDAVQAFNEETADAAEHWEAENQTQWSQTEQDTVKTYTCSSCGGELVTDANTAASFCPFCGNPTILPGRLSGGIRPDAVIPFRTSKEDATKAFLELCKGKPLLPRDFTANHRLEKITGIYVPFWLYECDSGFDGRYQATRVHHWSTPDYVYTRTEHFLVTRAADAKFRNIPMDGSSKMDDAVMESIEPYDFSALVDFDTAYLSGFFADKYDVEAETGHDRVRQRVSASLEELIAPTLVGYATHIPTVKNINVHQGKAKYVLLPVWMLHTQYGGKNYLFAMNGQTGKMTGTFPICPRRSWAWFGGITAAVSAVAALIQWMML